MDPCVEERPIIGKRQVFHRFYWRTPAPKVIFLSYSVLIFPNSAGPKVPASVGGDMNERRSPIPTSLESIGHIPVPGKKFLSGEESGQGTFLGEIPTPLATPVRS